ncbi:DUF924 family protein [Pararhizobium mangrovi]|uniref:DUF924 domain-containing protein n=1 Tax=Pararhizobium mangrovi TaxID=2590452 RepID=A0A506UDC1_9HYPH|nr:DUF924 family protein [Pararhizobium mangrovi]TPW31940.1 DUF924 domain-containing protein [Pararhizobium mangrovi]
MQYDDAYAAPADVLAFWFEELTPEHWFKPSAEIDARIRQRFAATHLMLARHIEEAWRRSPEGRLAATIVLDQFPRNIYRATPLAFATDELARNEARTAIEAGMDQLVPAERRVFFYLPFEHSEALEDQEWSVELIATLDHAEYLDYARRHREVIARFGRFPHRNPILGRFSTRAEEAYLSTSDSGF